jgi:ribokinase
MIKVLSVGDVNVDVILRSGRPPKGKQVFLKDYEVHGGGCAANFSLACARLGAKVKLLARVGDDHWGSFVLQELEKNGVDVQDVKVAEGKKTGVTFALVEGVERSFITYRGENSVFSADDFNISDIRADIAHFPSFFLLEGQQSKLPQLMELVKERGALVSFDTGWDPFGVWSKNKILAATLKKVDVFLPNLDEAREILKSRAGDSSLTKKLLGRGLKAVTIKEGERGSFVADCEKSARVPPFKVDVVDTTGAGDVFNAAFMLSYFKTKDVALAGRFANAAAAISVTGAGWAKYPKASEVNAVLRSSGFQPVKF